MIFISLIHALKDTDDRQNTRCLDCSQPGSPMLRHLGSAFGSRWSKVKVAGLKIEWAWIVLSEYPTSSSTVVMTVSA